MITDEELKKFLPQYLSRESYDELISELKSFPENIDDRMYTSFLEKDILYQGDGLKDIPVVEIPNIDKGTKLTQCIILSNTCDMDLRNKRFYPSSIMYAPIINLNKYISVLKAQGVSDDKIKSHISSLKEQKISPIIFLPHNSKIEDSIVFLDRILNIDTHYISRDALEENRLFSLSNYGFYLLLFKLSVHFSRILENVDRGSDL